MERESNIKAKRAAKRAKQRRKKQLILAGGAAGVLLLGVVVAGFVFSGGDKYEADTNTLYLLENGKVVSVGVETFDENVYDKEELKAYIQETIDDYNMGNGEKVVKQKSLKVKDGTATLVLEYANAEVFETFEGVEIFTGTMSEAIEAGYTFTERYADVTGDKAKEALGSDFSKDMDYKVAVVKANTTVQVDGTICYVSIENTAEVGEHHVLIKDGSELEVIAFEDETLVGTEAEGSDGAIGEDELEVGTEMQFDFGEDDTEKQSQHSDVYTYIIYK